MCLFTVNHVCGADNKQQTNVVQSAVTDSHPHACVCPECGATASCCARHGDCPPPPSSDQRLHPTAGAGRLGTHHPRAGQLPTPHSGHDGRPRCPQIMLHTHTSRHHTVWVPPFPCPLTCSQPNQHTHTTLHHAAQHTTLPHLQDVEVEHGEHHHLPHPIPGHINILHRMHLRTPALVNCTVLVLAPQRGGGVVGEENQ